MYRIETEKFSLELTPGVRQADFPYPESSSVHIKVSSYGFSADTFMDIDEIELINFAVELNDLYETLQGSAILEEPYGMHTYIKFAAENNGHISVWGRLNTQNAYYRHEQMLEFQNEIDQTYLRDFTKALFDDYGRYAD